jgi:8-oxo-dGTP pyrophosphatase MutT (NUDIX family)
MTPLLRSLEHLFAVYPSRLHPNQSGRRAAVLVPLIESGGRFDLLLTKRTETVEHHKGQISFPGGAVDACDDSLIAAALREAYEEVGLPADAVRILGALDEVSTPSGFLITPIIGVIAALPELSANPAEVREIFCVPFEAFFDESRVREELRVIDGIKRIVYFYDIGTEPVWGATAFIIHRLVALLREYGTER